MKKLLLATSAIALMGLSGAASAQSVLERVLSSINVGNDNMLPVTGTFANIAENIAVLGGGTQTLYSINDDVYVTEAAALAEYNSWVDTALETAIDEGAIYQDDIDDDGLGDVWTNGTITFESEEEAVSWLRGDIESVDSFDEMYSYTDVVDLGPNQILNNINGSVTNVLTGVTDATASVGGTVMAIDQVKVDIGDVSTTVLGAVNTGTTSLGVNSDYNRAIAGTSSAVSGKVLQLGGIANQTALVLNVASNATSVVGSVSNTFTALNGSVGNIGTTVLGAVNTGTISSGVNAATNGIVSGIVGTTTP